MEMQDRRLAQNEAANLVAEMARVKAAVREFIVGCWQDTEEGDGYWTEETTAKFEALVALVREE